MSGLLLLVPSRGRPQNARRLLDACLDTCRADTTMVIAVDDDDPTAPEYPQGCHIGPRRRLGPTLNELAMAAALRENPPAVIGFMGDDHLPRTIGWDARILDVLTTLPGIAYGDDLVHGPNLPTAWFMSTTVVRALGWFALPGALHLFLDNAVKTVGELAGCLHYLPDVTIEHLHPIVGKAPDDAGYAEVNSSAMWANDEDAYQRWQDVRMDSDVAVVRAAVSGVVLT